MVDEFDVSPQFGSRLEPGDEARFETARVARERHEVDVFPAVRDEVGRLTEGASAAAADVRLLAWKQNRTHARTHARVTSSHTVAAIRVLFCAGIEAA